MGTRRRKSILRPIGDLLSAIYPSEEEARTLSVFGWWHRKMPPRIVKNARPIRLRRGILIIHTSTSSWASELEYMRDQILVGLRQHDKRLDLRGIRFRVGPLPSLTNANDPPLRKSSVTTPLSDLPEELARILARIPDDDLRSAIADSATIGLARCPNVDGDA
ncbi:MAG: DUF721 domain-containing protein [Myxococcota bacterium]